MDIWLVHKKPYSLTQKAPLIPCLPKGVNESIVNHKVHSKSAVNFKVHSKSAVHLNVQVNPLLISRRTINPMLISRCK